MMEEWNNGRMEEWKNGRMVMQELSTVTDCTTARLFSSASSVDIKLIYIRFQKAIDDHFCLLLSAQEH
jgi:hypothetical protein